MTRLAPAALTLLLLAGCQTARDARPEATPSTVATPGGSALPARTAMVTLIGENLEMLPGEANAVRIGFEAASPSARLIVDHAPGTELDACALEARDAALAASDCVTHVAAGVRETIARAGGLGAIALILTSTASASVSFSIEYDEGGRSVAVRMPRIGPPPGASACKDNACNPFFEMLPVRSGAFSASASWRGGDGLLHLLSGRVRAHSYSATGVPYDEPARAQGPSPLSVRANLSSPAEYALALYNAGTEALTEILFEIDWP